MLKPCIILILLTPTWALQCYHGANLTFLNNIIVQEQKAIECSPNAKFCKRISGKLNGNGGWIASCIRSGSDAEKNCQVCFQKCFSNKRKDFLRKEGSTTVEWKTFLFLFFFDFLMRICKRLQRSVIEKVDLLKIFKHNAPFSVRNGKNCNFFFGIARNAVYLNSAFMEIERKNFEKIF